MKSVNTVFLLGYLGADPVSNQTKSGFSVSNFSIACDESYKSEKGDLVEKVEWINCSAFGKIADVTNKYFKKGDRVHLRGKIKTDVAEKDGEKRYYTKVKIEELLMLGGKKNGSADTSHTEENIPADVNDDLPF